LGLGLSDLEAAVALDLKEECQLLEAGEPAARPERHCFLRLALVHDRQRNDFRVDADLIRGVARGRGRARPDKRHLASVRPRWQRTHSERVQPRFFAD
jgi:hypothetical protein